MCRCCGLNTERPRDTSDIAKPRELAYLTDRVRVNQGREQVFGTQMRSDANGMPIPQPIEDPERLDERRVAVGLDAFEEYAREFAKRFEGP